MSAQTTETGRPDDDRPLIVFGNFVSDVVCGRAAGPLNLHGMVQSSRKVWLTGPGDLLLTQYPVGVDFRRYACRLLGHDPFSVTVVDAAPDPTLPLAEALRRTGLMHHVQSWLAGRRGVRLLPVVLDRPTVHFAASLGVSLCGYERTGVPDSALDAVDRLNTKSGFRTVARRLGIRVPEGCHCQDGTELVSAVRELLGRHREVLVKPVRAAGGHGVRPLTRADLPELAARLAAHRRGAGPQPEGWVAEEHLAFVRDVSAQLEVGDAGPEVVYTGEMRTRDGGYHGLLSPLAESGDGDGVRAALEHAGLALGAYLAERGYRGRFNVDAGVTRDGTVYVVESNVRRTAATARHALVRRLAASHGHGERAWLADAAPGGAVARGSRGSVNAVHGLLQDAGLAYSHESGEGVVIATEATRGSGWSYVVIGADRARAESTERTLRTLLGADTTARA
ncbi:hypothetical protein DVA86_10355 [Streptomyces armeniacus]|uniref:ATP-grasp domain-containing protein n=1 Tax=Streptomyces armeniacus TaxID=83291 RepID=A0A345XMX4_9ACTN|nr:peptide ligase PGM1-related protein [Streptomyces armeniacus]AXK32990.1 hypothetical protein DVA86_10355 [Streptomyces armeniacus]